MNTFDAAVYFCLIVAVVFGFRSGLLRSLATIIAYLAAAPVTVALVPTVAPLLTERFQMSPGQILLAVFALFVALGMLFGALLRRLVDMMIGPRVSAPDRMAGAALGAVRIGLIAVLLVAIFDRLIPAGREPAWLADSKLRPALSKAGQLGLKSLPPDVEAYLDRLQRARRL